ncbi:phosphoenolpyruvate carboxylase-like protein [Tanacetum coccineum]
MEDLEKDFSNLVALNELKLQLHPWAKGMLLDERIAGDMPKDLELCESLHKLDLPGRLSWFSVMNNELSGSIMNALGTFVHESFEGNSGLCGAPLRKCGSLEEIKALYQVATSVPKMANMLEGGGKMPILTPLELEDIGYKVVAYPLSMMGDALVAIKGGRVPELGSMPSFDEVKEVLGFNIYYEEEKRYATKSNQFVMLLKAISLCGKHVC